MPIPFVCVKMNGTTGEAWYERREMRGQVNRMSVLFKRNMDGSIFARCTDCSYTLAPHERIEDHYCPDSEVPPRDAYRFSRDAVHLVCSEREFRREQTIRRQAAKIQLLEAALADVKYAIQATRDGFTTPPMSAWVLLLQKCDVKY